MDASVHFFEVIAQQEMICTKFSNFVVEAGTAHKMLQSWKCGEDEIHEIVDSAGLVIGDLSKSKNSGMRQYLLSSWE